MELFNREGPQWRYLSQGQTTTVTSHDASSATGNHTIRNGVNDNDSNLSTPRTAVTLGIRYDHEGRVSEITTTALTEDRGSGTATSRTVSGLVEGSFAGRSVSHLSTEPANVFMQGMKQNTTRQRKRLTIVCDYEKERHAELEDTMACGSEDSSYEELKGPSPNRPSTSPRLSRMCSVADLPDCDVRSSSLPSPHPQSARSPSNRWSPPTLFSSVAELSTSLGVSINGQLTYCSEAMNCLVPRPSLLQRLDALQALTANSLLSGGVSAMEGAVPTGSFSGAPISSRSRATSLSPNYSSPQTPPRRSATAVIAFLVAKAAALCMTGSARRRRMLTYLIPAAATLVGWLLFRARGRSFITSTLGLCLTAGMGTVLSLRVALVPQSLSTRSPFAGACRSIVLLKAAQSSLTEARLATSRHHVTNTLGGNLIQMQQQWLIGTLLADPFFSSATYKVTPLTSLSMEPQSPTTSPRGLFEEIQPEVITPEELEILIARAQHKLWDCVRYVSVLSGDGSYLPMPGDLVKLVKGVWLLLKHRKSLETLCSRLSEGFAPSSDASLANASHPSFAYHELYTHVQRLSGQLFLLRTADTASVSEEQRQQAFADLAEVVGALAGAWNRVCTGKADRNEGHAGLGRSVRSEGLGGAWMDDGDEPDPPPFPATKSPTRAEMSAQGEDPIPLYPDEALDEDVGSRRGALPENFADLLQAMRNRKQH